MLNLKKIREKDIFYSSLLLIPVHVQESSGGGSDQQLEDQDWTGSEDGSEDGGYAEYYSFNDDEEGRASQVSLINDWLVD